MRASDTLSVLDRILGISCRILSASGRLAAASLLAAAALPGWAPAVPQQQQLPPERILEVVPDLASADEGTRERAIQALARPDLGQAAAPERVAALETVALKDASIRLKVLAIGAIGQVGGQGAADVLARLVLRGDPSVRRTAASTLASAPGGLAPLRAIVRGALDGGAGSGQSVRPEVLAELMRRYGQWLADARAPERADYVPLVVGLKHPSPVLRAASGRAFDALVTRLSDSAEPGRASAVLGELQRFGIDRDVALYQRARIALGALGDATEAKKVAGRLVASRGVRLRPEARIDAYESQLWVFRGRYLTGLADCALGQFDEGSVALDRAADALDQALSERRDLLTDAEKTRHVDLLHQRALAEVARTFAAIARGREQAEVLERARTAHLIHLEAQAVYAELRGDVLTGWDALLLSDLSLYRLLFGRRGFGASGAGAMDRSVMIRLQGDLGRALAAVAPGELPGFAPLEVQGIDTQVERWTSPLDDIARRAQLDRIRGARIGGIDDAIEDAERALMRAQSRSMGVIPEGAIEEVQQLRYRRRAAMRDLEDGARTGEQWMRDLRLPGSAALWYAEDLTQEGRGVEARVIATRLEQDLRTRGISDWWFVLGHERIVRAQLMAGSAFTDEGKGVEAESVLLRAVAGIEDIERDLMERGVSQAALASFRNLRAGALVSLAVNANVRLRDSKKALGYYERAYELRKDEFMRTLMACYRARAGQDAEARALLRTIRPAPGTWYNLACTHALLGDTDRALDYLEAEITRNHASRDSANRQREWAAGDPDLESLRGESRFKRIVKPR